MINGEEISCMSHHGEINFRDGLAQSCNVVFAELAVEIGKEKMTEEANRIGITQSFNVGNTPTVKGKYDVSKAQDNDLGWSGIGQYTDLANPMQMAIMCGAVANHGQSVQPYFVSDIYKGDFSPVRAPGASADRELLSRNTADTLNEMMRYTVTSNYGDGMFPSLEVCAKTGTARSATRTATTRGWSASLATRTRRLRLRSSWKRVPLDIPPPGRSLLRRWRPPPLPCAVRTDSFSYRPELASVRYSFCPVHKIMDDFLKKVCYNNLTCAGK